MRRYLKDFELRFSFKQTPKDFFVEEILSRKPLSKGRFAILRIKKWRMSTWELIEEIGRYTKSVGYAGLKDKHATTIQHISIDSRDLPIILKINSPRWQVVDHFKSDRPLKMGDLVGNRFVINLHGVEDLKILRAALEELSKSGVPNYFGYQRFGKDGLKKAKAFIEGDYFPKDRKVARMLTAIYQSYLFNAWLAKRIELSDEEFKVLKGDVYRIGGKFVVAKEVPQKGIVTGLLPGSKVVRAGFEAARIERLFDEPLLAKGARRDALVYPKDIDVKQIKNGAKIAFFLPKGSYATIVVESLLGRQIDSEGV